MFLFMDLLCGLIDMKVFFNQEFLKLINRFQQKNGCFELVIYKKLNLDVITKINLFIFLN